MPIGKIHEQKTQYTLLQVGEKSNCMARLVCWINNPSKNNWEYAKKTAFLALNMLLTLSVVGLIIVIPEGIWAAYEWKYLNVKTKNSKDDSEDNVQIKLDAPIEQPTADDKKIQENVVIQPQSELVPRQDDLGSLQIFPDSLPTQKKKLNDSMPVDDELEIHPQPEHEKDNEKIQEKIVVQNQPEPVPNQESLEFPQGLSESLTNLEKKLNDSMVAEDEREIQPQPEFALELTQCVNLQVLSESSKEIQHDSSNIAKIVDEDIRSQDFSPVNVKVKDPDSQSVKINKSIPTWNQCQESTADVIKVEDLQSLFRLSQIKSGQKIDIYNNGTIGSPYANDVKAAIWRTARSYGGINQNSLEFGKLKYLMQRALFGLFQGCKDLEFCLDEAVKGLHIILKDYKDKPSEKEILSILTFIDQSMIKIADYHHKHGIPDIKPSYFKQKPINYALLDGSYLGSDAPKGTKNAYEGVNYFIEKIEFFLLLENLNENDIYFLSSLQTALKNSKKLQQNELFGDVFTEVRKKMTEERLPSVINQMTEEGLLENEITKERLLQIKDLVFKGTFEDGQKKVKRLLAEELIATLENLPSDIQSQIGIQIPMGFSWYLEEELINLTGHVFFVTLCKEENGEYTAAQINAGGMALAGEVSNVETDLHLNYNMPSSTRFQPVVEFPHLNREEAIIFLSNAMSYRACFTPNVQQARESYTKIFENIIEKKCTNRISKIRAQITGNCGVHNLKKSIGYSFQKYNNVRLGNRFLKYVDGRDTETLPFAEVVPLIQNSII